jgi:dihydrolipoamide dehydrogenase
MSQFDVTIIGSGPGGYVSAIRCAQLGFKTAIIEKYSTLGGTCLNVGCIPSKALLASSHHYEELQHFADHGIEVSGEVKVNLEKMIARKQAVVDQTSGGVKFLMDKNNITVFNGVGSFESATSVKVTKEDGSSEIIESKNIIIATGSKPSSLPFIKLDKERIITSTEALKLKEVPKHLSNYWWWCYRNRIRSSIFTFRSTSFCCRIHGQNYSRNGRCFIKRID